jgi:Na+-translocating ferredoxin:NAD+ oxidoreductase subunit G
MSASVAPGTVPVGKTTPSWKLLVTLGVAGALSGLMIIVVYLLTLPRVEAYKSRELRTAIDEVLETPARSDTLYLAGGTLSATRPVVEPGSRIERVYRGYGSSGKPLGYAIEATGPGFADPIRLLYGYDHAGRGLIGLKILDSKETPGIADGILKPAFTDQFRHASAPVVGVKASPKATDKGAVVLITGATISSRAIVKIINTSLARWTPLIQRYETNAGASPPVPGTEKH